MKKMLWIGLLWCGVWCSAAAQPFTFNHGPYLQELTQEGVTILFTTDQESLSWVELKDPQGTISRHYTLRNGLREAYNTFHAIRVEGLTEATTYEYRLGSKHIVDFQPYKVTFGDSIASPWYRFETPDPRSTRCSFVALSDMHQDAGKLTHLLQLSEVNTVDRVFYVGDMMNYYADPQEPFRSFIDPSVRLFASERPFVLVRGNHETRGKLAREYFHYVPKTDGQFYGAYRVGEVMFVILDCGEDKPDDFWVYAGLTDFDAYRTQEAAWFEQLIRTKEYRTTRWRVVMNHFPPLTHLTQPTDTAAHGERDVMAKFLPLYNRAKIDLMISGHTHEYAFMEPANEPALRFPTIVGSTETITRVDIEGKTMRVKVLNVKGKILKEFTVTK
ncbi:MAG: FN3 domain-containing metallophosphoesterase family protein [Alistipes sp.]|nr:FN3 domain-containing metallophosphoesterase family protein [Alistipes sp.]